MKKKIKKLIQKIKNNTFFKKHNKGCSSEKVITKQPFFDIKQDDDFEGSIVRWNNEFPIDYRWRKKYNIPFGSEAHKQANFIDMLFDIKEADIYDKVINDYINEKNNKDKYVPNTSNYLNEKVKTQKEWDEEYDNLEI